MTEWWTLHQAGLIGGIAGTAAGVAGGIYGTLVGMLAPKGIGGRILVPVHVAMIVMGAASLAAGIAAVVVSQPYHVYYPLLLIGVVVTSVFGGLLPVVLGRFRRAAARPESRPPQDR